MFDYQTSKHAHFDAACRAFALSHNLEDVAAAVGMRPQILRNKLNPIQPHRLTCDELLAITDYTEDARLLDGMLGQINCLPSVPVNILTNRLCRAQSVAFWRVPAFQAVSVTLKADRTLSRALACHSTAKKIFRRQKSHYTALACGFWIIKIFQFYFSSNLTARPRQCWRLCGKPKLKRLKRISVFFSFMDLRRIEQKT